MNALILFVKYPEPGSVKTRLGTTIGMQRAAKVYRGCAQSSFRIAAAIADDVTTVYVWFAPGANPSAIQSWVGDGRKVLSVTLRRMALQKASVALLPQLSDIDTGEDYHLYLARQGQARGT